MQGVVWPVLVVMGLVVVQIRRGCGWFQTSARSRDSHRHPLIRRPVTEFMRGCLDVAHHGLVAGIGARAYLRAITLGVIK